MRPAGSRQKWLAHRWVYTLMCGPIPRGKHLLHRCDNPACVNPDHLLPGTQAENMRDMIAKGRNSFGDAHATKLTSEQVTSIIADSRRQRDLAAEFGVSQSMISQIKNGKRWASVGPT